LTRRIEGNERKVLYEISRGLRGFLKKRGVEKVIVGISGGIDSAVVATIACGSLGADKVKGVFLPNEEVTTKESQDLANALALELGIGFSTVEISHMCAAFPGWGTYPPSLSSISRQNLQARVRAVLLMLLSNESGAVVLNTGNLSESMVGYCTLYGDTIGAVAPIGKLYKTEVYELARFINNLDEVNWPWTIPEGILSRPPTAELVVDQKDEDDLLPYSELDFFLRLIDLDVPVGVFPEEYAKKYEDIRRRVYNNSFKLQQSPPSIGILSLGRQNNPR